MAESVRTIVHLDLDAFFSACHELSDPSLCGRPVVVGADPQDGRGRGVVATANYEARRYGVGSAMPISEAFRRCPGAVFLRPNRALYIAQSQRVMQLLQTETALLEQVSIDEAYLDLSHVGWNVDHARRLRERVLGETGLPCSTGQATSKLVAKIACGLAKPGGALVVPPGSEASFLSALSIGQMLGIGPKTARRLMDVGINSIGDLAAADPATLGRAVGPRLALELIRRAVGEDDRPVTSEHERKSLSEETTFQQDVADRAMLWETIKSLSSQVAGRLERAGLVGRTVTLKLRYSAGFETRTRAITLARPVGGEDAELLSRVAGTLMRGTWQRGRPVRLLGVRVSGLCLVPQAVQLPLPPPVGSRTPADSFVRFEPLPKIGR